MTDFFFFLILVFRNSFERNSLFFMHSFRKVSRSSGKSPVMVDSLSWQQSPRNTWRLPNPSEWWYFLLPTPDGKHSTFIIPRGGGGGLRRKQGRMHFQSGGTGKQSRLERSPARWGPVRWDLEVCDHFRSIPSQNGVSAGGDVRGKDNRTQRFLWAVPWFTEGTGATSRPL